MMKGLAKEETVKRIRISKRTMMDYSCWLVLFEIVVRGTTSVCDSPLSTFYGVFFLLTRSRNTDLLRRGDCSI